MSEIKQALDAWTRRDTKITLAICVPALLACAYAVWDLYRQIP
jgi:hypothetical protein